MEQAIPKIQQLLEDYSNSNFYANSINIRPEYWNETANYRHVVSHIAERSDYLYIS